MNGTGTARGLDRWVPVPLGLLLVFAGLSAGPVEASTPAPAGAPSCAIVVGSQAPELERYAARELRRYLSDLYGIQAVPLTTISPEADVNLILGSPGTNRSVSLLMGEQGWPQVSDQGFVLKTVSWNGKPAVVVGGGSPAATLWAVYDLLENLGVRFLLEKDVLPASPAQFPPRGLDQVREPRFRFRSYRAINNLATSLIFYGMDDYRHLIDQLAKLKFNVLYCQIYPHQPFVHFQFRDQPKTTGVFHYGWKVPIHGETIGRELFGGRNELVNPDMVGAETYEERVRAAQKLLHDLLAYAKSRGMKTGINFRINQFTNEFNWRLPEWSDREYVPRDLMKGTHNGRLGISEYGVDPTAFPYMTPDNPVVTGLNKAIIRAHINTYPEADFYGLTQPENPGGGEYYKAMWKRLDRKYKLEPRFSLERMEESARTHTLPVGVRSPGRPLYELKGAIANADTLDKLLNEERILEGTANPDATVVVATFSDEFYPVMLKIFPERSLLLVRMDYLTSLAARRTEMLSFAGEHPGQVATLATLADDNVGILPQLPTQPLHRIMQAMERYGVHGFFGRQFLVTKLEAGTAYLAQASWSSEVTPESVYRDQVEQVCGADAVPEMMEFYRTLERATARGDEIAMGFLFPVTRMMRKHWHSRQGPVPEWNELKAFYVEAVPLLESALEKTRPEGRSYLEQLLGQVRFGVDYIEAVQTVRRARVEYDLSQQAFVEKDARSFEKRIRGAHGRLERAVELLGSGIRSWSGAVRDPSDLGALGVLNYFCRDYLKGVALDVYLEAENWRMKF